MENVGCLSRVGWAAGHCVDQVLQSRLCLWGIGAEKEFPFLAEGERLSTYGFLSSFALAFLEVVSYFTNASFENCQENVSLKWKWKFLSSQG